MKRKILLTVLVLTAVLSITPYIGTVLATPPTPVLFRVDFSTFGGTREVRQAGNSNNWIMHANTYADLIGDIEGSMTAEAYWIFHGWAGPVDDPMMLEVRSVNGHVLLTIDAKVDGKTGTIQLRFNDVTGESVGTWVIFGGTDELSGLHGQGTWETSYDTGVPDQVFEGQIHFDP